MSKAVSIVRADGEGEHLRFLGGGLLTIKASAQETGGAFFLFEDFMPQGKTTPLHTHAREDETLYVLEGEILVHVDGAEHRLATGGIAVAPRTYRVSRSEEHTSELQSMTNVGCRLRL